MADQASTSTQTMLTTLAASVIKNMLMMVGASLAAHGVISGSNTEAFVAAGMALVGAGWSFWNSYGRAIVLAKLEVWKATAQAQAETLKNAQVAGPTAAQIADKIPDPKVTAETVAKVVTAGCALVLAVLLITGPALAQTKKPALTGDIVKDVQRLRTDSTDPVQSSGGIGGTKLPDLLAALDAKLLPDLQYALKLAEASGSKVTAPCYRAWIDIINTRQKAVQDDATPPQALPIPDPHLVTDFEKLVELRNSLQPESPFMIACSPVASMVKKDILGFIGVVIGGGAGLATLVPGL